MSQLSSISPRPSPPSRHVIRSLSAIVKQHPLRLALTFTLVAVENALFVAYPLLAGFAIDAILTQDLLAALSYALFILMIWTVGAVRRAVDTRVFTRIYADIAVKVALEQRSSGQQTSTAAARVLLSREFVDFFEYQPPALVASVVSILGAVIMLALIEPPIGSAAVVLLLLSVAFLPAYARRNEQLHNRVHNSMEREIALIERVSPTALFRHYRLLSNLRIKLSDREAVAYLFVGVLAAGLFAYAIWHLTQQSPLQAGHLYTVLTYIWNLVSSADEVPYLADQLARIKNIGKRVATPAPKL